MAFIPNLDTKSFRDFAKATKCVLADGWRDNRGQFAVLALISAGIAVMPYALNGGEALLVNHLVSAYGARAFGYTLMGFILLVGALIMTREALSAFSQHYGLLSRLRRLQYYELKFNEKLGSLDVATHESPEFRNTLQVVNEHGSAHAVTAFFSSVLMITGSVIGVVTATSIVLLADWRIFLLIVACSLPRFFVEAKSGERTWSIFGSRSAERRQYIETTRHMDTALGVRDLQLFQTVGYFRKRQKELLDRFYGEQRDAEKKRFNASLLSEFVLAAAISIATVMLVGKVIAGSLQIGSFMFVLGAIVGLQDAVAGFFLLIASLLTDSRYVASFFDIMQRERTVKLPAPGVSIPDTGAPRIEFRNVSFSYPRSPDQMVLQDFSLVIEPGERIAFVGVNGAGKSTLMKLLCRFYDPTSGSILVNGTDLREVDLQSWYRCLGILMQDFQTYHLPAGDVIALGRVGVDDSNRVVDAAKQAHAHDFIQAWPDGYRHQIGSEFEGGTDPSGGQEQMLALARTLFRKALVTILDEPTAHVDAQAEQEIFEQLEASTGACRTLIFIAHRFSTVRKAHRICVIEDGHATEVGTHEELLANNKTYAALFRVQAEGYK
jgi:ATP-binding cassette subfamily B protein